MKKQICLMGGEVMPNVIGALAEKPNELIPIASRDSVHAVEWLRAALQAAGSATTVRDPVEILAFDPDDCRKTLAGLLVDGGEVSVNWTGGTKIMSYAARAAAEGRAVALYVNTADNDIIYQRPGAAPESRAFDAAELGVNILVQLLASGNNVGDRISADEFRKKYAPVEVLVRAAELLHDLSESKRQDIYNLARASEKPVRPARLNAEELLILQQARLIDAAQPVGSFLLGHQTLTRPFHKTQSPDANKQFLLSGYIEVHIWNQLRRRGGLQDVAWHVEINPYELGRRSEFDVIVFHNNRFLVIDCKVGLDGSRLASLIEETYGSTRRVGRIFGRWALYIHKYHAQIAAEIGDAGESVLESQKARAKDFGGSLLWRDAEEHLVDEVLKIINERPGLL